jgi:two-component system, cell cycle response regulator
MRILIVDSDRQALGETAGVLKSEGYETVTAESVKGGIRAIDQHQDIQIVIVDSQMRHGSAADLLHYLRSRPRLQHVAVIVCTASADARSIRQSIELGAREYVLKPFTRTTLADKVKRCLASALNAVLIVDDDEVIVDLLARVVKREGYKPLTAYSGEEALKILETERVFAIISDICMPGISGFDLLVKVKELHPEIHVLLITGQTGKFSREQAISAGADGYITKPFKNVELSRKLSALSQAHRYEQHQQRTA